MRSRLDLRVGILKHKSRIFLNTSYQLTKGDSSGKEWELCDVWNMGCGLDRGRSLFFDCVLVFSLGGLIPGTDCVDCAAQSIPPPCPALTHELSGISKWLAPLTVIKAK